MKGMIYPSCVRSAMLYGSKIWCLRENEKFWEVFGKMRNFEKDQESHGESNVWCKTDEEKEDKGPNGDVGIEGNSGSMAKANGVRWYGHVFRRDDGHVLRKALEFEVKGKRKQRRPNKM